MGGQMKHDLTTGAGRAAAFEEFNETFLRGLKFRCNGISPKTQCEVFRDRVEIYIPTAGMVTRGESTVEIYCERKDGYFSRAAGINIGGGVVFNPEDKAKYWRVVNAAEILKKWSFVSWFAVETCHAYRELEKEILQMNLEGDA